MALTKEQAEHVVAARWSDESGDPYELSLHLVQNTMDGAIAVVNEMGKDLARHVRRDIERGRQRVRRLVDRQERITP